MKFLGRGFWVIAMFAIGLPVVASSVEFDIDALPELSQEAQHSTAAKRITALYSRSHYRNVRLDDELSEKVFELYLQQLDYNRSLFLSSDIDGFEKYRFQLDSDMPQGYMDAFYQIYSVNQLRRYEQIVYSINSLDVEKPFDFTVDETFQFDRSEAEWMDDKAQLEHLWKQRVKNDALKLKLAGKEWADIVSLLTNRYQGSLKRLMQTESEDVFQIAMNALSRSIEPHTSYLSPRTADQFKMEMNLSLEGIGAVLQPEDEYTVIRSLVPGSPAAKSNQLAPDDRIVGVAQGAEELVDIIGWRLDDVVDLIKGPKGSTVRLEILPAGNKAGGSTRVVSLVRDKVRLEDRAAKSEVLEINNRKIGVLEVPSFYVNLSRDSAVELEDLKQQGIESLVIDLRGNGGGALTEATAMTGLFIQNGPVVQVRDQIGRIKVNTDNSNEIVYDGPMVVLVDRYSASASEIFAAAMQDYGRALVIGEQTFGKGTVQQHRGIGRIYDMFDEELGHVQYTIAKFYRINGGSTQHKGVIPDIPFPSAIAPEDTGESVQENALPWDHIDSASYEKVSEPTAWLDLLMRDHEVRINKDPEFQYILEDIEQYQLEKDDLTISLNETKRLKLLEEQDAQELKRTNERLRRAGIAEVASVDDIPEDYEIQDAYLQETAAIALEFADLSGVSAQVTQ